MPTPTIMKPRPKRPPQPIMKECDRCCGEGELQAFCEDCGNELDTASLAPGFDELCRECKTNRDEEKAEVEEARLRRESPSEGDPHE